MALWVLRMRQTVKVMGGRLIEVLIVQPILHVDLVVARQKS